MFWNINGRYHFLTSNVIREWISKFDLIFLSETHFTIGQKFKFDGFTSYHNSYSKPADRKPRGGISCFIRYGLMSHVIKVCQDYESHIVVMFNGGHRIFGSYIPPEDSPYYNDKYFLYISSFFSPIDSNCSFIGGGDLNSRVGGSSSVPPLLGAAYRKNPDVTVNSHGRMVKKISKACHAYVVNNLTVDYKNYDGNFTFSKGGRSLRMTYV